jgi:hypothetical protein
MRIVKYIIVGFILLSFWENLIAQKSNVFIEYQYLELTNSQRNLDVIKDNYRNAELVSDSIINNQDENYINAHFYYELANAYKIGDEYGMWAFSLLRQLILFPNDSLRNGGIQSFVEACTKLKIDKSKAVSIYKQGAKGPNTKNFTARLELLIEQSIELYDKDVEQFLKRYIYQLEKNSDNVSLKIRQWSLLIAINLDINSRKEILNNYYNTEHNDVFFTNPKLKNKAINKAEKYKKLESFTNLFIRK